MFKEYPPEAYRFTDESGEVYYSTPQQSLLFPLLFLFGMASALPVALILTLQIYLGR
jgi:hypothetical protein